MRSTGLSSGGEAGGVERGQFEEEGIARSRLDRAVDPEILVAREHELDRLHSAGGDATTRLGLVQPQTRLVLEEPADRQV